MEGFTWRAEGGHRVWGTEVPSGVQGQNPAKGGKGSGEAPEVEAKYEISVQFLTFSCIKFWI